MTPNKGGKKYAIKYKKDKLIFPQAITVIAPLISWTEIYSVPEARADLIVNQVELAWLNRFPSPIKIIVDRGKDLLAEIKFIMANDYGIPYYSIGARNLQANAIMERVHQIIGNITRTFDIQDMDIQDENTLEGVLSSIMFALPSKVSSTKKKL